MCVRQRNASARRKSRKFNTICHLKLQLKFNTFSGQHKRINPVYQLRIHCIIKQSVKKQKRKSQIIQQCNNLKIDITDRLIQNRQPCINYNISILVVTNTILLIWIYILFSIRSWNCPVFSWLLQLVNFKYII